MKLKLLLIFLCIGSMPSLYAQNGALALGSAQSMAMGNAGVAFSGAHSLWRNQAGLALLERPQFIAAGEQRFLLSEIRSLSAGAAYPTSSGVFGLSLNYFGFDAFNQQQIGLAYGRKLLDQLSIGARFLYMGTRIPEYGQRSQLTFEIGVMAQLLPELQIGAHIHNPLAIEVVENEILPTIFSLGLAYRPSEKLLITGEAEKDIDFPVRAKFGLDYQLIEALSLRAGVASNPSQISFGVGYQFENGLSLNVASTYHQYLGATPGFDVTYRIGER